MWPRTLANCITKWQICTDNIKCTWHLSCLLLFFVLSENARKKSLRNLKTNLNTHKLAVAVRKVFDKLRDKLSKIPHHTTYWMFKVPAWIMSFFLNFWTSLGSSLGETFTTDTMLMKHYSRRRKNSRKKSTLKVQAHFILMTMWPATTRTVLQYWSFNNKIIFCCAFFS